MEKLKAKLKKQGGFTLIEMLIVVAIIAILIAIAIPMVNSALEDAREATDAANERSAVGLAMVEVLTKNSLGGTSIVAGTTTYEAYYQIDDSKGSLVGTGTKPTAYGKSTALLGAQNMPTHENMVVKVTYDTGTGDFDTAWE